MLQHVALEVRRAEVEVEVAFWALLGFERVEPPPALAARAAWVESAGVQIHLLHAEAPATAGHIALVAPDFVACLASLAAAGFAPEPRTPHWGAPRAYARSPAGHLVELMAAAPPTSSH